MHGSLTELANDPLSASESIAVQMATRGVFPSMITDPDTIMTIQ